MHDKPRAMMLFAAGFGSRMRPLTDSTPKPLIPVGGAPMIDRVIALARQAGIGRLVANAHYHADQIQRHFSQSDVQVSLETPEILETGGGLRAALPLLGPGPVFTANCDAIWTGDNPFKTLLSAWNPDKMDALLLLIDPQDALGHEGGDFDLDAAGRVRRGGGAIYSGVQIIRTEALSDIPQSAFSLNLLWDQYISKGRAFGAMHRGKWCDVGKPEAIPLAEGMLQETGHV